LRYSSNKEDAKEILGNAFIRVFKKLDHFDPIRPFEAWFSRIIVHASSDYYRYAKVPFLDIEPQNKFLQEDPEILDQLSYDELLTCVTKLSPQYRLVFNMYVVDGYKHYEIAESLNISIGTSKSNLNKAKKQLKKIIQESNEVYYKN
jgi:RNA polymerase sigma-70 factor (ECF subfamily)